MGRPAEGWKLRLPKGSTIHTVRFSHRGRDIERSTGERDPERAAEEAARIYSAVKRGGRVATRPRAPRSTEDDLGRLAASWLSTLTGTLDPETITTYAIYFDTHLAPFFIQLSAVTPDRTKSYIATRLKNVLAQSVRKELAALRGLLAWALENPPELPGIPKRVQGTRFAAARRRSQAIELAPSEVARLLAALPVRTRGGHAVKARFIVAYETSLRPETLDALRTPDHYRKGSRYLRIPPELDKARAGRPLPLSPAARRALDSVCPRNGLLFGAHDYRIVFRKAAKKAKIPEHKRLILAPYDLRHARITHWLEETDNVVGVQYMAGHKHLSTTARYVRPSLRAAEAVLGKSKKTSRKR